MVKRVFNNLCITKSGDQCQVEPHICKASQWLGAQKLISGSVNPPHLRLRECLCCAIKTPALLDLYEYETFAVLHNQVNFTRLAPPPASRNCKTTPLIVLGNATCCPDVSVAFASFPP